MQQSKNCSNIKKDGYVLVNELRRTDFKISTGVFSPCDCFHMIDPHPGAEEVLPLVVEDASLEAGDRAGRSPAVGGMI